MSRADEVGKRLKLIGTCILELRLDYKIKEALLEPFLVKCLRDEIGMTFKHLDHGELEVIQNEVSEEMLQEKRITFISKFIYEDDGA